MKKYWMGLILWALGLAWAQGQALPLDQYLDQVKKGSRGYASAQAAVGGLDDQSVQGDLVYAPKLDAHAQRINDRQEQPLAALFGTKTVTDDYGVGLSKKWSFGADTSLNYGWSRTDIAGSSFAPPSSYQVRPSASVSMPLWRDFAGSQTRAQVERNRSGLQAAKWGAAARRDGVVLSARQAYWSLQYAREETAIRTDTLERARKLAAWSARRAALNLTDASESLQAQAGVRVRELELQQALEREREARREFNQGRGREGDEVPETLGALEGEVASASFNWPGEAPRRHDIRAAEWSMKSEKAAWKDVKDNAKPDLRAYLSATSNGLDSTFNPANRKASEGNHPTMKVGAQLSVPLDIFTAARAAKGYEKGYQSAQMDFEDKKMTAERDWKSLNDHRMDVDKRLVMAAEILRIQKEKAEQERVRLNQGRSTQFQVQSFENDYSQARLSWLALAVEKLSLWARGEFYLAADRESGNGTKE